MEAGSTPPEEGQIEEQPGEATNAETGESTPAGESLPPVAEPEPEPAESEPEPQSGVADATHPAPATTPDPETGEPRQHGQIDSSLGVAPSGDSTDEQSGDVSAEAADELGGVHDSSDQGVEVERPDVGTPGA